MVNYRDATGVQADFWALTKLWYCVDSIYLWEFVTTLNYEWSVIRGHRPYGWSIWIYSFTRIATLVAVVLNIVYDNITHPINCQVWIRLLFTFPFLAFMAASLLIVLRIIAIWNKNKFVVAIATSIWVTNVAFLVRDIILLFNASWVPVLSTCVLLKPGGGGVWFPSVMSILTTDLTLILIMLLGLLRLRCHEGDASRLGKLLWKQGVIWLLLAAAAEVPPTVVVLLGLNAAINLMFRIPALIIMSIAATRIYRSLSDSVSDTRISTTAQDSLKKGLCTVPKTSRGPFAPIQLNRTEVAVHMDVVQYPVAETSCDACDGSCINIEAPLGDKPDGQVLSDIESAVEN